MKWDTLDQLCGAIKMPEDVCAVLHKVSAGLTARAEADYIVRLCAPAAYDGAVQALTEALKPDEDGMKMLKVMLAAALHSHELYAVRNIGDDVFIPTMQCFSRFVCECREIYGKICFDRAFWVGRQLSLLLFRIGELEYELASLDGAPAISLHIPSDANLTDERVCASISAAQIFLQKYCPDYADKTVFCESWLLSPALKKVLPPSSKILAFQKRFTILHTDENADSYKRWVFKDPDLAPENFPEQTTLQRNLKKYVLSGGKVGETLGILNSF